VTLVTLDNLKERERVGNNRSTWESPGREDKVVVSVLSLRELNE